MSTFDEHAAYKAHQRAYYHKNKKPPKKKWSITWVDDAGIQSEQFTNLQDIQSNTFLAGIITSKDRFYHLRQNITKDKRVKIERL